MEARPVSGFRRSRSLVLFAPANYSMNYNPKNAGCRWLWARGTDVAEKRTNPSQPGGHHICSK